jgi:hypothetical protein
MLRGILDKLEFLWRRFDEGYSIGNTKGVASKHGVEDAHWDYEYEKDNEMSTRDGESCPSAKRRNKDRSHERLA